MNRKLQADINLEELRSLSTGIMLGLNDIVDCNDETDAYFLSSQGLIIHTIRSPFAAFVDKRASAPTVLELFDLDGNFLGSQAKRYLPAFQFAARWTPEFRNASFVKLSRRPSFVATRNADYSATLVPFLSPT